MTVCDPEHSYFSGLGSSKSLDLAASLGAERLWGAGRAFATYLSSYKFEGKALKGSFSAKWQVVELGAGCGLPGMVMARNGSEVTLTDVPWLLQMLTYNVAANFHRADLRPSVAPLRWGNATDAAALLQASGQPDLVIGAAGHRKTMQKRASLEADLVYRHQDFDALLASIAT